MATNVMTDVEPAAVKSDNRTGKYLIFELGGEEYGISVLKVREIMGMQEITAVPQSPSHVRGIINLRGKIVPVVDLRRKFGLEETEQTRRSSIVVVEVSGSNGSVPTGIVVDGVAEVLNVSSDDVENPPNFGESVAVPYLMGLAKVKGKVKILLEIDQALNSQEMYCLTC